MPKPHRAPKPLTVLIAAREKAGMSQAELAEKLDVSPSTVAGWELGTHGIRIKRVPDIARILHVDVGELLEAAAS